MLGYTRLYTESLEFDMHTPTSSFSLLNNGQPLCPWNRNEIIDGFQQTFIGLSYQPEH